MATQNIIKADLALILAKDEVAYGTDPSPTELANALLVRDFELTVDINMIAKSRLRATYSSPGAAAGRVHCAIKFSCPAVGSPDPGVSDLAEPDFGKIFKSSGMSSTPSGSPVASHAYAPDSTSTDSLTFYIYLFRDDGSSDLYEVNGCRFGWTIKGSVGDTIATEFEGLGLFNEPVAASPALGDVDYNEAFDEAVCKGMTVTVGGVTRHISEFELSWNRTPNVRDDMTGTHGVGGVHLSSAPDESIMLSFNPEMKLEATYDHLAKILGEEREALSIVFDTAGGSRWTIAAPKLQPGSYSHDEDAGIYRIGQECYLTDDADTGDDAVSITISRTP